MKLATPPIGETVTRALTTQLAPSGVDGPLRYVASDVVAADREGLLGFVHDEFTGGRLELDDAALATLETLAASAAREATILESRAAAAVMTLTEAGIETRILKGLAVSHLDYDCPNLRQFCDVDLLVRGHDLEPAVELLREAGYRRHFPEPFDGFDERIGKGVAVGDDRGVVIDVHRTLALGYYGTRFPVEPLWDDPEGVTVAGVEMQALPPLMRFIHCALHLALAPASTMASGLDLVMLSVRHPEIDTAAVTQLAEEASCSYPVARAIARTTAWIGESWAPPGLASWAAEWRPTVIDRVAMAAYEGRWAGSRARSATAVFGLRGADRRFAARAMFARSRHHGHG